MITNPEHQRYGRFLRIYVSFVSFMFQFVSMCAELTGIGDVVHALSPNTSKVWPVLGVAITTTLYTVLGGLRSSIATDVVEGVGILILVFAVCLAMFIHVEIPDGAWSTTQVAAFTTSGFEALVTLCIAVTSANLFLTGFWQRVWAAKTDTALRQGCYFASLLTIPFAAVLVFTGMVYVASTGAPDPTVYPFFYLLGDIGPFWDVVCLVILILLVSSSVDTIQNGIVAECLSNAGTWFTIHHARGVTGT